MENAHVNAATSSSQRPTVVQAAGGETPLGPLAAQPVGQSGYYRTQLTPPAHICHCPRVSCEQGAAQRSLQKQDRVDGTMIQYARRCIYMRGGGALYSAEADSIDRR